MTTIVAVIQHYQRSIDNSQDNEERLMHCINKLYNLPIKVEHLQETGVGKTVNSLRKFNGEIGVAAKTLVTKWKAMVAAEEEPMDTTSQTNDSETHNNNNDGGATPQDDDEDDENHNLHNTSPQEQNKRSSKDKDKHKERHKERSSSSSNGQKESRHSSSSHQNSEKSSKNSTDKLKSSSSSSSKDKGSHHKSSSSSSSSKDKEREKEKNEHKTSKDKHKDKDHDKDRERSEKRKEDKHKDDKMESSSSHHHKSSSSSSSKSKHEDKHRTSSNDKDKERSDKHKSSSKDKERTKEEKPSAKDKDEHKSSSSSASTSKSSTKDKTETETERKRRHNSDNESNDFKSPQPKLAKVQKSSSSTTNTSSSSKHESKPENSPPQAADDEEVADDSFDSSMGTNFNDILGMLDVPKKKSKKSIKSSPSITTTNSSSSRKETTPNRPSTSSNSNSSSHNTPTKVNGVRTPFASSSSSYSAASTSKATLKPDLLAPTAKLEPLDPSIALELPSISTNYKPMPLNQTVMDCVFNFSSSASNSKPGRILTESEAITHGISSKTMRTKIYSGVRTGQTFQVPSLFDMCIRVLQKNIDALEYTGGVPFEVLRPVLDRATPQQLYNFEEYNPYLMEDSDLLWQVHVSRNYRIKKRQENESWREMYIRCQEEEEEKLSMLKNNIKASQKIAAAPIRKTQLAFVDSMVKPPRNVLRKQEQYGTKSKMVATPASRVASLQSVTPNAAKTGDQRLKVPSAVRDPVHVNPVVRNKKAPLMQKTLQFIRGRLKR